MPGGPVAGVRTRLVAGSLWTAAAWIVAVVTGPPLVIVLVHLMPRVQFGDLAVATSVVALATPLAGLGMAAAVAQIASSEGSRRGAAGVAATLRSAVRLASLAAVGVVLVSVALLAVFANTPAVAGAFSTLAALLPAAVLAPYTGVFTGLLQATYQPRLLSVALMIGSVVGALAMAAVLAAGLRSALGVTVARTGGEITGCLLLAWSAWRWYRRRLWGEHAPTTAPVGGRLAAFGVAAMMSTAAGMAVSQLDVLIVGIRRGSQVAALYAPASRVADFAVSLPPLIGGFLLPALAAAITRGDRGQAKALYHWASRWSLVLCSPALVLMLGAPKPFLRLLFGLRYGSLAQPLRIMGAGAAVHVALGFNGLTLDAHGVPGAVAVRGGIGIIASLVGCLVLLPLWGLAGAAAATGGALVLVNVLCSATLYRRFGVPPWDRTHLLTVTAFLAAALLGWLIGEAHLRPVLSCLAVGGEGAVVTGVVALLSGGGEERAAVFGVLRRAAPVAGHRS